MTNEELMALAAKEKEDQAKFRHRLHICTSTGCVSSRSDAVYEALQAEVKARGWEDQVLVKKVGCMGLCAAGPIVSVQPANLLYRDMTPEAAPAIIASLDGEPVAEKILDTNIPFFYRQEKNVLENAGVVNPERIEDYIAEDGYSALVKVLTEMSPAEVIQEINASGLRGRGGAGFSTGLKWSMVAKAKGDIKYVICNGDEGDPGAFMDRSVLEADPHRVLEGMAIAAYAVGAEQGYIYVRAEYPLAIKRLKTAIRQAERMGFFGSEHLQYPPQFQD